MNVQDLPIELQNKIFYYTAEHPCAKMIKDIYKEQYIEDVEYGLDEDGEYTLIPTKSRANAFQIESKRNKCLIYGQEPKFQGHWENITELINNRKRYREELGDFFDRFFIIQSYSIRQ